MKALGTESESFLERRFQVVVGKGGVGRTLIASAIALRAAKRGKRTLLLEVNAPDHCARVLGVNPVVDTPKEVLPNLELCRMTPAGALREYALMILKFPALYRLVFENPLVKYFLKSIPSLGEFTMLGKAWYHCVEDTLNRKPRYDCVIIDAPATGHALTFLSVARVVADTVPAGPMKSAAIKMANLIEDQDRSCVHLVAIPEEMPVNEGLELSEKLRDRVGMQVGLSFINRVSASHSSEFDEGILDKLEQRVQTHEDLRPYVDIVRLRWERLRHQKIHRTRFESQVPRSLAVEELRFLPDDQSRVKYLASSWASEVEPASGGEAG